MSAAALPLADRFARPPLPVRRFSVDEYRDMGRLGWLSADDRVELLEGWITPKMMHNLGHALAIENGQAVLQPALPAGWRLRVQLPITTEDSEPEPDFAIVRQQRRRRRQTHPVPGEIAVVIEVSDSTLDTDRRLKGRLYARAEIPFYWIVNLLDARVEVYSDPSGPAELPAYRKRTLYSLRKAIPLILDGDEAARIAVSELVP